MAIVQFNFNSSLPAALTGYINALFQKFDNNDTEVRSISMQVPILIGDTGAGGVAGVAPAPGAGDAAAGKFLSASGIYDVPAGGGGGGGNLEGGNPTSIYGGISPIDGGTP